MKSGGLKNILQDRGGTCLSVLYRLFVLHLVATKQEEEVDQSSSARSVTEKAAREEKGWG
jgi:hypothetical protein